MLYLYFILYTFYFYFILFTKVYFGILFTGIYDIYEFDEVRKNPAKDLPRPNFDHRFGFRGLFGPKDTSSMSFERVLIEISQDN